MNNRSSIVMKRPLTSNRNNLSSLQHLTQLRKTNLINILSTKTPS